MCNPVHARHLDRIAHVLSYVKVYSWQSSIRYLENENSFVSLTGQRITRMQAIAQFDSATENH